MSKAVVLSIRPKWVVKIASGEKTIEVRKTLPKLDTPFKAYIYCTMPDAKDPHNILELHGADGKIRKANGKVIGEFTCDAITRVNICGFWDDSGKQLDNRLKETCLTTEEFCKYLGENVGYGWHISNLKIYDAPRKLSEFRRATDPCDSCHAEYTWECTDCKKLSGDIKRPPQSWCYVEAMKDE